MLVLLDAFAAATTSKRERVRGELGRQLEAWARARAGTPEVSTAVLERGVLSWTRLHGVVSIELLGGFEDMGIDPALLYDAEVERLVGGGS